MRIAPADQHAVFLHEAEPRGGFARAGEDPRVASGAHVGEEVGSGGCDAGAAGERVEGDALAEEEGAAGPAYGGDVRYRGEGRAFGEVPFYAVGIEGLAEAGWSGLG